MQTAQLAADLRNKLRAKAEAQGVDPAMVDKLSDEDVIAIENMVDTTSIRAAYQDDVELQNFPNISRGPTGELIGPPEQLNRYIAHRPITSTRLNSFRLNPVLPNLCSSSPKEL
ncbi:MAG: hypothetical protein ACLPTQ_19930 [Terriglobales bacterium]